MTPTDTAALVIVLTTAAAIAASAALALRSPAARPVFAPMSLALLVAALLVVGSTPSTFDDATTTGLLAAAGVAAVTGGGPLTVLLLDLVDRDRPAGAPAVAGTTVLRGGAWIGALERAAVVASIAAGWPEGVALALAVKGLGRYAELKEPGAAERFIIGTFASVLWAAAWGGVVLLARS